MRRLILLLTIAAMPLLSHATDEPEYEVIKTVDKIEFRKYSPYVVAEVVLNTIDGDAGNQAFPILAGYIFGKNKGEKKFAMTAPVMQIADPMVMNMTVPVIQSSEIGAVRVQFVLPKGVTLATAPEPIDPRVQLRLVAASTWAVIRYSGSWSKANYQEHLGLLRRSLETQVVATEGEPVWARYDAPYIPWFIRRNEIWLALR